MNKNKSIFNKFILGFLLFIVIFILAFISYGKAFHYDYWRDDWFVLWAMKYKHSLVGSIPVNRMLAYFYNIAAYQFAWLNSDAYQIFGFFIKLLNSIIICAFAYVLTRSIKGGIFAGLLYASYFGGLEAYSWTQATGLAIGVSLVAATVYLYSSYAHKKPWSIFLISLVLVLLAILTDFGRAIGIVFILLIWEGLNILARKKFNVKYLIRPAALLFIPLIYLKVIIPVLNSILKTPTIHAEQVNTPVIFLFKFINNISNLRYFFESIGHLFNFFFFAVSEQGGLSDFNSLTTNISIFFVISTIIMFFYFIRTKSKNLIVPLMLAFWIPSFYFASWLWEPTIVVGPTHRYIAASAVAIPLFITFFLYRIKEPLNYLLLAVFILINIVYSNSVTERDYLIRGREKVEPIWQKMDNDVPKSEINSIFLINGDSILEGYVFQWSSIFPYVLLRGIDKDEDMPIEASPELAAKLICDPQVKVVDYITGEPRYYNKHTSLDNIHGWYLHENNDLQDTTEDARIKVAGLASCLEKQQNIITNSGLTISSTTYVDRLTNDSSKVGVILNLENTSPTQRNIIYTAYIASKNAPNIFSVDSGVIEIAEDKKILQLPLRFKATENTLEQGELRDPILILNLCSSICGQEENKITISI